MLGFFMGITTKQVKPLQAPYITVELISTNPINDWHSVPHHIGETNAITPPPPPPPSVVIFLTRRRWQGSTVAEWDKALVSGQLRSRGFTPLQPGFSTGTGQRPFFVNLPQGRGFLWVLRFPPPMKLTFHHHHFTALI